MPRFSSVDRALAELRNSEQRYHEGLKDYMLKTCKKRFVNKSVLGFRVLIDWISQSYGVLLNSGGLLYPLHLEAKPTLWPIDKGAAT